MRGARSTATWTSPSSIAAVMRWIATLVGPKAVHIEFASRPSRPAQSEASFRNDVAEARSSARAAATAPVRNSVPYTDSSASSARLPTCGSSTFAAACTSCTLP